MSGINNPYAQGGWSNPQNPWSINNDPTHQATIPPSIFGALPFASPQSQSRVVEFQFTALNPDILNSIVLGPHARHCFSITTSAASYQQPSITLIRNDQGAVISRIEWHQHPFVELQDMIPKQYASQLIPLSQDMSHRTMIVKGKPFAWTTHGSSINLYNTAYNPAELLGSVSRAPSMVALNMTQDAIHRGMLGVCVLVAVLLYSGRKID